MFIRLKVKINKKGNEDERYIERQVERGGRRVI
ncbi:MAG: hypothetical protein MASP_01868 [Candidatus Methanolliviera sp. GoM_asphalt]|nr:MAG: hypothetical protein MASP_01868 [Candidatus Methanolliviera sp. GoM_asphalt]